jgi:predicted metal-dependent hydrolase
MFERIFSLHKKESFSDEFDFTINIKRTVRKTISLIIRDGELIVRCSKFVSNRRIYSLIREKEHWIKKNILIQKEKKKISKEKYIDTKTYLFLGEEKKLKIIEGKDCSINLTKTEIIISGSNLSSVEIKFILSKWYKKKAIKVLIERTKYFSKLMNLSYNEVIIKDYKSKWGLCFNLKKKIYLNWRLIMAPISVLEYVIIHELCHLRVPNHSKQFWEEVQKYRVGFKKDKMWLAKNGFLLFF